MHEDADAGDAPHGGQDWAARINHQELGALTATVQRVQAVVGDERSSLQDLTRALQHDSALVARVLRIANSPGYAINAEPVTTITRASSLIGFDSIRNICITSRLLEVLLAERELSAQVRERLLRRVASSLHAAIQARMLLGGAEARVREEAFLATLLQGIGESAFWSSGGAAVEQLDAALAEPGCDEEEVVRTQLGGSFHDISAALARAWGLDAVLATDAGRHPAMAQVVHLADRIAVAAARDGWQSPRMRELAAETALLLHMEQDEALIRMRNWSRQAEELASCYGAGMLARLMTHRAEPEGSARARGASAAAGDSARPGSSVADTDLQQLVLRQMEQMRASETDLNTVIRTAMHGIHAGIGMERTLTALLAPDRSSVQMRFVEGDNGEKWGATFRFTLPAGRNVLRDCIAENHAAHHCARNPARVPPELRRFSAGQDFVIAPIVLGSRSIGLLYADRAPGGGTISEDEYRAFANFATQLGLCLTAISRRRP